MTVNLGGRHLAAPTRFAVFAREVIAGALIVLIAAAAGLLGGLMTGVF